MSKSKKRKIDFISPERLQSDETTSSAVDWSKCFISQENSDGQLQNSFNSNHSDDKIKESYNSLAQRIQAFIDEGICPITVNVPSLQSEFDTFDKSLYCNKASFHKKCKLLFNTQNFEREKKRKLEKCLMSPAYKSSQLTETPTAASATLSGIFLSVFF